jgi:rSAM/selenodomain-associated transferase 2
MQISIIIPTLNEEACVGKTLAVAALLQPFEIIIADGGSTDRTVEIAREYGMVVESVRGRGAQQRTAAETASGDVLWFLHADSIPNPGALEAIWECLADKRVAGGNFSLCFDGEGRSARQLTLIYPRLRWLGLCYGDSGIFVRRAVYQLVGGFQPYPIFEDVDLVRRIRRVGSFRTLSSTLVTSSRRFEHRNFTVMFAEWTVLQVLFWAGVSPYRLARLYKPIRSMHSGVRHHGTA